MFDFFKSLFGGAYYIGKIANEKSKRKEYDLKREKRQALYNSLSARIGAPFQICQKTKNDILDGNHYEEICEKFKNDFRFVLGVRWKDLLQIPPKIMCHESALYASYNHVYWVYHLMLASQGKVDKGILNMGYLIGGINDAKTHIKFAQCIEGQLLNAGVTDIKLALELENVCGKQQSSSDPYGGSIKIVGLANYPTHRLWDDYCVK